MAKYGSFIDSKWRTDGDTFGNISPVTNVKFADIADANKQDATDAVESAHKAFAPWAALSGEERKAYLLKVAEALESMSDEIEEVLIDEVGSWIGKAKFESVESPKLWRAAAELATQVEGYELESPIGKQSKVIRAPLGVCTVISPWNVPLNLSSGTSAGILAVGNTVVLKPSELSPVSGGVLLGKAIEKAGLPKGVYNVVTCSKQSVEEVGEVLVTHPKVKAISFTGSTAVGKMIAGKASALLKKVSIELGGKDAIIILEDADIERAVNASTFASFFHGGQICMGAKRIYVQQNIYDEFVGRFVANTKTLGIGDVRNFGKPIPPMINKAQADMIMSQIKDATDKGATILTGGTNEGLFIMPTILAGVTSDMETYEEESFGPIVSVYPYDNVDEALEKVNASKYGLSGSVITKDKVKGFEVARKMESGMCHVNDGTIYAEANAPFGGVKNSGIGRYRGLSSIESFTQTRWITIDDDKRDYPPMFKEKQPES